MYLHTQFLDGVHWSDSLKKILELTFHLIVPLS